jgi:hypothetical protein
MKVCLSMDYGAWLVEGWCFGIKITQKVCLHC